MNPSLELKPFNTLGIEAQAKSVCIAGSAEEIYQQWLNAQKQQLPVLILGGGSNVLFIEDFDGAVILNRIRGITITETPEYWHVYSAAGENWHQFIEYLMGKGIYGAENLALIPGCVGSAPIQNIGAYGVELKDLCEYVDTLNLQTGKTERIEAEACHFGYRDSIFKHDYQHSHVIIGVGLKFAKQWSPKLTYGDLALLDAETVTPQQVFDAVCQTRKAKLPDPAVTGNVGSFFKNPIITADKAHQIKQRFPTCPQYAQEDGSIKVAAGWLIDQCGLKGYELGGAAVHTRQALVLINKCHATGRDIVDLAKYVSQTVHKHFGIMLEPEVRFIGKHGEINPMDCIL
ncbi:MULTISPECIES: UDP-N-acetylmuramate dehydrogenase [Providencia]|uniref:UDP-N-acetylenolpyruvoylglucosamine reductase n=1 Tax=Providencia stuartii ATCC 25827 TaxID=471874 RepID=A0AA87CSG7_PROST|nr:MULTISPECIES: UDP-N-acetylmuramate dehydrogenase [Providencia]EDU60901.1 UDP-N-acetylmuramate dehydrogenase [Providencia stuartii ATCC 25827]AIN63690.1 UDP-N-acetylenolpyruvoylglucosamine reductase [Providencia stuartii]APG52045.1 UDP-N-acetylenolpyruvoylglucosamine reductase [Providencia stuartii]AVL41717.1 UDP-N-acetylmuramate dehydrogenase [Providencia stuartii]EDU60918.1 UDP-N-acetylmuramate dehydrogenase [Providencia stuartii ATCC 25827]